MERAVKAAAEAGVSLVAYASFVNTATSTLQLGEEHKQTEAVIRASGLPYVMLRNGAYTELYAGELGDLDYALLSGVMIGSAGDGKISGASRGDLAEAAAVVLTGDGREGKVYELGGASFTMADLAAAIGQHVGKEMAYQDLPVDGYAEALAAAGVPEAFAGLVADTSFAVTRGDWYTESTDLQRLIGRPTTPLATTRYSPARSTARTSSTQLLRRDRSAPLPPTITPVAVGSTQVRPEQVRLIVDVCAPLVATSRALVRPA